MIRNQISSLSFAITLLAGPWASAQIDPASGLLLNQRSDDASSIRDSGLDSGRYTIRPKTTSTPRKKNPVEARSSHAIVPARIEAVATPAAIPPVGVVSTPVLSLAPPIPTALLNSPPVPDVKVNLQQNIFVDQRPLPPVLAPIVSGAPSPTRPLAPMILVPTTASPTQLAVSKDPAVDHRLDVLNVNFAPIYFLRNSKSDYDFRNYQLNAPGLSLSADAWLRPDVGIHTSFLSTLGGSIKDSLHGTKNTDATEQWFAIGGRYRRFSGMSPLSSTLSFGLDWVDSELKVPSDAVFRQQLKTNGFNLSLGIDYPVSDHYAWTAEVNLLPAAKQTEGTGTLAYSSGNHSSTNAIGLSVGGRVSVDREDAIYWKISGHFEKDNYSGTALPINPTTGQTLRDVSVTTSTAIFELGYSWGD